MNKHFYECARAGCFYTTIDNRDGLACPECSAALIAVREAARGEMIRNGKQPLKQPIPLNTKASIDDKLQYLDRLTTLYGTVKINGIHLDIANRMEKVCDSIEKDLALYDFDSKERLARGGFVSTAIDINSEKVAKLIADAVAHALQPKLARGGYVKGLPCGHRSTDVVIGEPDE
ncbi:hypothetical protein BK133_11240 [Paenibacillus sp. FSL H8-0548]|uniref:hypothetical protein n=1 Tax=Paenibacillus sp. FSL H8-0548 TaxID=1920422 RepID=UPI00096D9350|nr:hypothetical protein [Paenibacillus sp. FSL H8-0548]OMF35272.1 hypothetical protein BK133_11240 [Paenibacillus sp. FSL H8-0548]